ncbi:hypothetical protein JCM10213_000016 [Rhodosporidiobolus nylandii]
MPAFSGLQTLLAGVVYGYSGLALLFWPAQFLERTRPLTEALERRTELKLFEGGSDGTALAGVVLSVLGYSYVMTVYTLDEKAKRNSTSARILTALLCYYACTSTPHGSSLVALFGLFNLVSGLLMGLSVGWGDGNAVDLELKQRVEARRVREAQGKGQ